MTAMMPSESKKRVRFSDAVDTGDLGELDTAKVNKRVKGAQQLTRLPQGEVDDEDFTEQLQQSSQAAIGRRGAEIEDGGSVDISLPEEGVMRQRKDIGSAGAGSLLDDVADAEADYDEPDELMDWDGVPLEPFNLKAERERGYFDAEGNYLEFSNPEDNDAWLASLADDIVTFVKAQDAPAPTDEAMPKLPEAAIRDCKRKLVALLQPGENVLEALRRLGQSRGPESQAQAPQPQEAAKEAGLEAAEPVGRKRGSQMPAENRAAFETLTEASSQLLASGDYGAHSNPREHFQREVAAQEALDDLDIFEADAADIPSVSATGATGASQAPAAAPTPSTADLGGSPAAADAQMTAGSLHQPSQPAAVPAEPLSTDPTLQQAGAGVSHAPSAAVSAAEMPPSVVQRVESESQAAPASASQEQERRAQEVAVDGVPVVSDQNGQWYAWRDGSYQLVA